MIQRKHRRVEGLHIYIEISNVPVVKPTGHAIKNSSEPQSKCAKRKEVMTELGNILLRYVTHPGFSPHYWLRLRNTMSFFFLLSENKKFPVRNFMKVVAINFYFSRRAVCSTWMNCPRIYTYILHFPFESNVSFILCWWQHLIPRSLLTWTIASNNGRRLADSLRLI